MKEEKMIEYINEIEAQLLKDNYTYIRKYKEYENLMDKSVKVQNILCGEKICEELTKDEVIILSKCIEIQNELSSILKEELYYRGAKDAYCYFKNIHILK